MSQELVKILALTVMAKREPVVVFVQFASGRSIYRFVIDSVVEGGMFGHSETAPNNRLLVILNTVETVEFV